MHSNEALEISELEESDVRSILGRNSIGRLGFVRGTQIDVLPLQYVYADGSIYGRSSPFGKLAVMGQEGTEVGFEVDEIDSSSQWRSVLVHGILQVVERESGQEDWLRALGIVRRLHRHALRDDDPTPERTEIFRITIQDATGRAVERPVQRDSTLVAMSSSV